MRPIIVLAALAGIVGCGHSSTPEQARHDARVAHLLKTSQTAMTPKLAEAVVTELEATHGVEATRDKHGYPIYDYCPWELPLQEFSWTERNDEFTVGVAFNQKSHIKTAPDVEHRYVEIHHCKTSDKARVLKNAERVWQHFAREIEERHPQANYKMVNVHIWIEGQDPSLPVGRLVNTAAKDLPEHPDVEWNDWVSSPLNDVTSKDN